MSITPNSVWVASWVVFLVFVCTMCDILEACAMISYAFHYQERALQRFFFSRNIDLVTPKISYFHHLIKYLSDQSIQEILNWKLTTQALVRFSRNVPMLHTPYVTVKTSNRKMSDKHISLLQTTRLPETCPKMWVQIINMKNLREKHTHAQKVVLIRSIPNAAVWSSEMYLYLQFWVCPAAL